MPSAAAAVGLTYDTTDLQAADLGLFLELVSGLDDSPEVRGVDVVVPYADGRTARPRRFDYRRIVLGGHVMSTGDDEDDARAVYRATRRALAILFDPTREPATLEATTEDGEVWAIEARPLSLVALTVVPGHLATVSVELEAVAEWALVSS